MASNELKNIFLSASIPLRDRDPKYIDSADIIAIRDSVIALTTVVLPEHKLIWGGHPSITPLINYVMERLALDVQQHVKMYQSLWFADRFPEDNNKFENIVFTNKLDDVHSSLKEMRTRMLSENKFSIAVFIGGMEGVDIEYKMFREMQPDVPVLPIASTGAASRIVYEDYLAESEKDRRLVSDYAYMSLFQNLLLNRI